MTAESVDVDAAIRRYQAGALGASGESPEKVDAVHQLELHLVDPAAEAFLVSVLRNSAEYDLARVEICKALHAWPSGRLGLGYAAALVEVLHSEEDILIKQWAARALRAFRDRDEVAHALAVAVADADEDPDVRHNAVASLRGVLLCRADRVLLGRVVSSGALGLAVTSLLREGAQ